MKIGSVFIMESFYYVTFRHQQRKVTKGCRHGGLRPQLNPTSSGEIALR